MSPSTIAPAQKEAFHKPVPVGAVTSRSLRVAPVELVLWGLQGVVVPACLLACILCQCRSSHSGTEWLHHQVAFMQHRVSVRWNCKGGWQAVL